jgi:SAM-dependent methyltransferase
MMGHRSFLQTTWDFVGIPFRLVLFDQKWLPRFRWTTLEDERLDAVMPYIRGRLLDIGAGPNTLVKRYGDGVGVDVVEWGGGAVLVEDTSALPFDDGSFDTVTLIACLNHIPYREAVLREARRLLRPEGRLIITMINPVLGDVGHAVWWYSEDKHRGGMKEGEVGGMWNGDIVRMCKNESFELSVHSRFVFGMNNLLVFERTG